MTLLPLQRAPKTISADSPANVRFHRTTAIVIGISVLVVGLVIAWFMGEPTLNGIATQIHQLQEQAPGWLHPPQDATALFAPTLGAVVTTIVVQRLSPKPQPWSKWILVPLYLALTSRYLVWRLLSTLNLSDPLNGVFSVGWMLLELLLLLNVFTQLLLLLRRRPDTSRQADQLSLAVQDGTFAPSVDVLIPTFNESPRLLRRTIIGCQAMDYAHKTIYLLDDGRRPAMQALAAELGCQYISREDNRFAKAGNLNHALPLTQGDLITVFDADYIPTRNFLTRTLGFFQDPTVVMVQTPQNYYNADPVLRNLGLEDQMPPEDEYFHRYIQTQRATAESVYCSGTSFVMQRQALLTVGGFETHSLVEDFYTGVKLLARGGRHVYLNEKLSAGLAPETIPDFIQQRLRWARGNLQGFFIDANPITIRGLRPLQRFVHIDGLMGWFQIWPRLGLLLMPVVYALLNVIPIRATLPEVLFFLLPYYGLLFLTFSWLNQRSRALMFTELYTLLMIFPQCVTTIETFLRPYTKGFWITPKGNTRQKFSFNWPLALPLITIQGLLLLSLGHSLSQAFHTLQPVLTGGTGLEIAIQLQGLGFIWLLNLLNVFLVGMTLLALIDAPQPDIHNWLDLRRTVKLQTDTATFWGITTKLSEGGAEIALTQPGWDATAQRLTLTLLEEHLQFPGTVTHVDVNGEFPTVQVAFNHVSAKQHRQLVELLFCRPGQWDNLDAPSEWECIRLLLKSLICPRIFCTSPHDIRATTILKH